MAEAKAGLRRTGRTPYGWDADAEGRLTPNAEEQRVIARLREWDRRGRTAYYMARVLNKDSVKAKNGGKWYPTTITKVLATTDSFKIAAARARQKTALENMKKERARKVTKEEREACAADLQRRNSGVRQQTAETLSDEQVKAWQAGRLTSAPDHSGMFDYLDFLGHLKD